MPPNRVSPRAIIGSWYHIKAICLEDITWTQPEKQNVQVKRLIQAHQILKVTFLNFFLAIVLYACMSDQIRSDKKIDYLFTACWEDTKTVKA